MYKLEGVLKIDGFGQTKRGGGAGMAKILFLLGHLRWMTPDPVNSSLHFVKFVISKFVVILVNDQNVYCGGGSESLSVTVDSQNDESVGWSALVVDTAETARSTAGSHRDLTGPLPTAKSNS